MPGLRAAVAAGIHCCDLGADGRTAEQQLALDSTAKAQGVLALIGMGLDPGLDNLLAVHASQQFDQALDLQCCFHLALPDKLLFESLDALRGTGRIDPSWQLVLSVARSPVSIYREGQWVSIDPLERGANITSREGHDLPAYPVAMPEPLTLPRFLTGVRSVSAMLAITPPQLGELVFEKARWTSSGDHAVKEATQSFLETIAGAPDRWFEGAGPDRPAGGWSMWVVGTGKKEGRLAHYMCSPQRLPQSTTISLAVAALRILRGEVSARGVLPAEACFKPASFFEEAAQYARDEDREKPLLWSRFEWLD